MLELMLEWNQRNAEPAWSVSELERKVEDAMKRGERNVNSEKIRRRGMSLVRKEGGRGPLQTLLTAQEVARMLNVSDKLVYRMANRGTIMLTRIEGCIRFHPDDIASYLAGQRNRQPDRARKPARPHLKHIKLQPPRWGFYHCRSVQRMARFAARNSWYGMEFDRNLVNSAASKDQQKIRKPFQVHGFKQRGRRESNPQPPDRQSGTLTN